MQREPRAEPDTRFVYVLKPTSRARQESPMSAAITKRRIPSHGDISHHCLFEACHRCIVSSSSANWLSGFLKNPEENTAESRNSRAVCEARATPSTVYRPHPNPRLLFD